MTGIERQIIITAIRSMYLLLALEPNSEKFTEEMIKKTDYQLACIFKSYTSKLKNANLERPKESFLFQPIYEKVENLLEINHESVQENACQKQLIDEETLDILYFLESQCLADYYCGAVPKTIALFDSQKLEKSSQQDLLDILAICCHYQIQKISAEEKTKSDLELPVATKIKISKWTQKIREIFPCTSDYYVILQSYPEMAEWDSKPIEECFEDMLKMLEPFLYDLSPDEKRYLKREIKRSGE